MLTNWQWMKQQVGILAILQNGKITKHLVEWPFDEIAI
jgi:hypothetical protein